MRQSGNVERGKTRGRAQLHRRIEETALSRDLTRASPSHYLAVYYVATGTYSLEVEIYSSSSAREISRVDGTLYCVVEISLE